MSRHVWSLFIIHLPCRFAVQDSDSGVGPAPTFHKMYGRACTTQMSWEFDLNTQQLWLALMLFSCFLLTRPINLLHIEATYIKSLNFKPRSSSLPNLKFLLVSRSYQKFLQLARWIWILTRVFHSIEDCRSFVLLNQPLSRTRAAAVMCTVQCLHFKKLRSIHLEIHFLFLSDHNLFNLELFA